MNQRSTNRSFDAAMRLFKTRQRLEGGGVGENEGDRPTLGGVGGLALCAGLGLHGSSLRRENDTAASFLHGLGLRLGNVEVPAIVGDVAPRSGGLGGHAGLGEVGQAGSAENGAGLGGHGGSKSGPIPAMSNPKAVTSDVSSPFSERIMNGPIPYQLTPAGRAIAAAYKKRQEEGNGHR